MKGELKGLVVATNKNIGFYYKEMCAYMTGYVIEDDDGWEESEDYLEKYPLIDAVMEIELDGARNIYSGTRLYVTEDKCQ